VRLFRLAEKNLTPFAPLHYGFDVAGLLKLIQKTSESIVQSDFKVNPWSPGNAPELEIS
jgi:hypothetical protein